MRPGWGAQAWIRLGWTLTGLFFLLAIVSLTGVLLGGWNDLGEVGTTVGTISGLLVAIDRAQILEGARLARQAFASGSFPGWMDLQIGAAAVLYDEEVATSNPDPFAGLGCEVWPYRDEVRSPGPRNRDASGVQGSPVQDRSP